MTSPVFYLKVSFGTNIDTALMESPTYDITGPACVKFYYQISTPKITLTVLASTLMTSQFTPVGFFSFAKQITITSWNLASVRLDNGVVKLRFFAEKTSITSGSEFVSVEHVELTKGRCSAFNDGMCTHSRSYMPSV